MVIKSAKQVPVRQQCGLMFIEADPREHVEMYLQTLWLLEEEEGEKLARVSSVSRRLKVSPPSAVQMLKKLESQGYVKYETRQGVRLTANGRREGRRMVRNRRLAEAMMTNLFKIDVDQRAVCGMEHHITEAFANAICTTLQHPRRCPHHNEIPKGACCPSS